MVIKDIYCPNCETKDVNKIHKLERSKQKICQCCGYIW